jgi:thiamine kinase-like enzyme
VSEPLNPEVAAALDRAGRRIRAFCRLSKIHLPDARRSVYRVDLESGHTIKVRCFEDEEIARRVFEIRCELPDGFARAFARYGAVLLEDWIEGESLENTPPSDAHLFEAAALLAELHAKKTVVGQPLHGLRSTAAWRNTAERCLREICAVGALDEPDALLIRDALQRLDPQRAIFGLAHTDFCGENMVVDRTGRLRVVDNERVGIDALGFDVARTWYRWALPGPAWERFRSVYAARAQLTEPLETVGFWGLVAVVHSAALRLQVDRTRVHAPLDRLRQMAVDLGTQRTSHQGRRGSLRPGS